MLNLETGLSLNLASARYLNTSHDAVSLLPMRDGDNGRKWWL
jgi:hypothetical protein